MSEERPYSRPRVFRHDSEKDRPFWIQEAVESIRRELGLPLATQPKKEPEFVTLVDSDRRYVEVSESFCQLVGYRREELIGRRYDELTAPDTSDIEGVFALFSRLGYMQGLWVLVTRRGTRVLVRY